MITTKAQGTAHREAVSLAFVWALVTVTWALRCPRVFTPGNFNA
jgi:hypothetical protein